MIFLKTEDEIELLRESNQLVGKTLAELARYISPGVTTIQLDQIAESFIRDHGAEPTFKGFPNQNGKPFPASICTSINEVVVHGIPDNQTLIEGDIVSIDCGVKLNGFCGDSAYTFAVGQISSEKQQLLDITKEALYNGINAARVGNRIGDIGHAVQSLCEENGYGVLREFTGHGIGKEMHEDPFVPNFGKKGTREQLLVGLCIAIEPMVTLGNRNIKLLADDWTVATKDGKPAAHFEHTIAITHSGPTILSSFEELEKIIREKA